MNINLNTKDDVANIIRAALVVEPIDPALTTPVEVPLATLPKPVWDDFNTRIQTACADENFSNGVKAYGFEGFVAMAVYNSHFLIVRTKEFDMIMAIHGRCCPEFIKGMIGRNRAVAILRDKKSAVLESYGFKAEMLDGDPVYIWRP